MLKKCSKLTINLNRLILAQYNLKIVILQPIKIKYFNDFKRYKNVNKHRKSITNYWARN